MLACAMPRKIGYFLLLTLATVSAQGQNNAERTIVVPERVAALIRPILDLRKESTAECGQPGKATRPVCLTGTGYERERERWRNVEQRIANLISHKTAFADEALVVLMSYYVGESGEHEDEVINRGSRMLPYLLKYQNRTPVVPNRTYADSLRVSAEVKQDEFKGAVDAIRQGRKIE